jgi:dihydroceramide fatty acyl 2-hydroxylase
MHDAKSLSGSEALVFQVGHLQENYWEWVHQPVPGQPRFFRSSFAERFSKTPWWVIPLLWLPVAAACALWARHAHHADPALVTAWMLAGIPVWQLLEYSIHRFIFHANNSSYWGITFHFLFHGCHHKFPFDKDRLVFPPASAVVIVLALLNLLRACLPGAQAFSLMAGVLLGYVAYDCLHYAMHHGAQLGPLFFPMLRKRHCDHHFKQIDRGYGISSTFFDLLFDTDIQK